MPKRVMTWYLSLSVIGKRRTSVVLFQTELPKPHGLYLKDFHCFQTISVHKSFVASRVKRSSSYIAFKEFAHFHVVLATEDGNICPTSLSYNMPYKTHSFADYFLWTVEQAVW